MSSLLALQQAAHQRLRSLQTAFCDAGSVAEFLDAAQAYVDEHPDDDVRAELDDLNLLPRLLAEYTADKLETPAGRSRLRKDVRRCRRMFQGYGTKRDLLHDYGKPLYLAIMHGRSEALKHGLGVNAQDVLAFAPVLFEYMPLNPVWVADMGRVFGCRSRDAQRLGLLEILVTKRRHDLDRDSLDAFITHWKLTWPYIRKVVRVHLDGGGGGGTLHDENLTRQQWVANCVDNLSAVVRK